MLSWVWRVISVRLRFLFVLAVAFLVVAEWDVVRNYWDRLTQGALHVDPALQAVSADTEYFCPMDPGVASDWPGKCGICNMALVRRKRGEAPLLPEGVVARMQFTPYRLQLGGIRTTPLTYRKLIREVEGPGRVRAAGRGENTAEVEANLFASQTPGLAQGQEALVFGSFSEPFNATVRSIRMASDAERPEVSVLLAVFDSRQWLRPGMPIQARIKVPIAEVEPFRSMPTNPPALRPGEKRRVYRCAEHFEVVSEAPGRCLQDKTELERIELTATQRLRWWCPMHPDVTSDVAGRDCALGGGMRLVPKVESYNPPGEVLALPETSVVDTGKRTLVYLERMPGMFDGVEVVLGPRCGDAYPVVRGLEPSQRVVTAGSFLVDAETRLNPSAAAGYFGAARRETAATSTAPAGALVADELSSADKVQISRQRLCVVTGKPLGSMGIPVRVVVGGRTLFLCCQGCEDALRKDPARFLVKLPPDAQR